MQMIKYEPDHDQIVSPLCRDCPDRDFRNQRHQLFNVGCCSYSPVFTLFEIDRIVRSGGRSFLMERLYLPSYSTVRDYEIVVHAWIHPQYDEIDKETNGLLEAEDLKQDYSICRFFVPNQGCGLPPSYKTSVCRAFVCTTIEQSLSEDDYLFVQQKVREIYREASRFHHQHKLILQRNGWNLKDHPDQIFDYLEKR